MSKRVIQEVPDEQVCKEDFAIHYDAIEARIDKLEAFVAKCNDAEAKRGLQLAIKQLREGQILLKGWGNKYLF